MAVIALLDGRGRRAGLDDLAPHRAIVAVENVDPFPPDDGPVALIQIGDPLSPRSDGQGVRSEVILALAITDGQRRTHARADDQIGVIAEQEGDGERAGELWQHRRDCVLRRSAALNLARDEVPDDLRIGLALERASLRDQLVAQRLEVLDNAVVHQRHRSDDVRVGVADGRRTVGRPARVGDPRRTVQRLLGERSRQIFELALGPPPLELAVGDRANAGGIVAAILQALETVEQALRDVRLADDPDDTTHASRNSFDRRTGKPMPCTAS